MLVNYHVIYGHKFWYIWLDNSRSRCTVKFHDGAVPSNRTSENRTEFINEFFNCKQKLIRMFCGMMILCEKGRLMCFFCFHINFGILRVLSICIYKENLIPTKITAVKWQWEKFKVSTFHSVRQSVRIAFWSFKSGVRLCVCVFFFVLSFFLWSAWNNDRKQQEELN